MRLAERIRIGDRTFARESAAQVGGRPAVELREAGRERCESRDRLPSIANGPEQKHEVGPEPLAGHLEQRSRVPTLMAVQDGALWRFDVRLQGEGETVFLDA